MLNKEIKNQLNKCMIAKLPEWDDDTYEMIIPRKDSNILEGDIVVGKNYLISFEDYIIHPYSGFTLHDNWNNGIVPTDKEMCVLIAQIMGKMIKMQGVGRNDSKAWAGWIPRKSFTIIGEID